MTQANSGALTLESVSKRYGDNTAVADVSLDIAPGEFVTLLGPSGSGKTTTLSMIAGFIRPSGGRIVMDGRELSSVPSHKREIGVVFQNYALFPHMNAEDNVAFPLRMRRRSREEIEGKFRDLVELLSAIRIVSPESATPLLNGAPARAQPPRLGRTLLVGDPGDRFTMPAGC